MTEQEIIEQLPNSAREVAEVIGLEATLALAQNNPSRTSRMCRVYVPMKIHEDHWIAQSISSNAVKELESVFGGMFMPIATCAQMKKAKRNEAIMKEFDGGMIIPEIAIRYKLTKRMVRYILVKEAGKTLFWKINLKNNDMRERMRRRNKNKK